MQLVSRTLSRDQTVGHPWYGQPSRSQSSVCLNNVCAETQTRRFKAIVAGASVYQDPAVYAKSSPITFIEHSHTPVLILQANATRKFRRRKPSSFTTRCRRCTCRRVWWCTPTKVTARANPRTKSTFWTGSWGGLERIYTSDCSATSAPPTS